MENQSSETESNEQAQAKSQGQEQTNGWGPIFSGALQEMSSHSWLQNFLIGLALLLVWPLIGATLMKSYRATIIGFGIGATILIWIGVVILVRQAVKSEPRSTPISVSPEKVDLFAPKGVKAIQEIFVHNQTQIAYYDVWVKVMVNSPSIEPQDVSIGITKSIPIPLQDMDPAEALDRLLVVTRPAPGTNFFSFSVNRLGPGQTKRFLLSRKDVGELSSTVKHEAVLTIERFTTSPGPIGERHFPSEGVKDRPNIILKDVKLIKNPTGRPAANIELANIGTDGFQFSASAAIFAAISSEAEKFRPSIDIPMQSMDFPAGSWVDQTLAMKPVDNTWKEKFAKGEISLYVWGEAKYQDKMGKWFHYDFCRTLNPQSELWEACSFHNRSY